MGTKISQMAAASQLLGAELLEVAQPSTTITITATTISAAAADKSFNDSASGFAAAGFQVGDTVRSSGFSAAADNINSLTITAATAAKLTFGGADGSVIVNSSAGPSVTITKWKTARMTVAQLFGTLRPVSAINNTTAAPPGSPADGDTYIIASGASGAWSGFSGRLARWNAGQAAWDIITPIAGLQIYSVAQAVTYLYSGSVWVAAGSVVQINNQTGTTYTFGLSDAGKVVRQSNAGAITDTLPTNASVAFPLGTVISIRQVGAGQVTVTPAGGVTLNIPTGYVAKTGRQHATIMLHKVDADEWDITGDLGT